MKFHLFVSDEPVSGGKLVTLCGASIREPEFAAQVDETLAGGNTGVERFFRNLQGVCRKCVKLPITKRYIYAAREATYGTEITPEDVAEALRD